MRIACIIKLHDYLNPNFKLNLKNKLTEGIKTLSVPCYVLYAPLDIPPLVQIFHIFWNTDKKSSFDIDNSISAYRKMNSLTINILSLIDKISYNITKN